MDLHGSHGSYLHLHQARVALLLSPSLLGQPEMAAARMVGQFSLCGPLVLRSHRLLHFPMLACPVVLDAVLSTIWKDGAGWDGGAVQCHDRAACGNAPHIRPRLGRRPASIAYHEHPEAPDLIEEKAWARGHFLRGTPVSNLPI